MTPARVVQTAMRRTADLEQAVGIIDTHLVDSHRRGTSGVW